MSTEIPCAASAELCDDIRVQIGTLDGYESAPRVLVRIVDGTREGGTANPTRADFIAAVEKECDGIFIPRADLPEVVVKRTGRLVVGGSEDLEGFTADENREEALHHLALAEYLDANPPVDEAEVEALADAIKAVYDGGAHEHIARRLVAAGWKRADR